MYGVDFEVIAGVKAPKVVVIKRKAWNEMLASIEQVYPVEACGVMLGRVERETAVVEEVRGLRNILASNRAFWFDVAEWMQAILEGKERGKEYIGVYHSHARDEPLLSLSDRQRMLECPGEVWVVVSYIPGREPKAAAWVIRGYGLGISRVNLRVA